MRPIFTHTRIHPWADMTGNNKLLRDHEYFISSKIHENPSSGSRRGSRNFRQGGGGSNLPKNFDKRKKNQKTKKKKKRAGAFQKKSILLKLVEIYFCNWNSFQGNNFHKYDLPPVILFLHTKHIWDYCFSMVKCVSYVTVRGGFGGPPPETFGFSGVKSCHFRQKTLKLHFYQSQGSCVWRSGSLDSDLTNI